MGTCRPERRSSACTPAFFRGDRLRSGFIVRSLRSRSASVSTSTASCLGRLLVFLYATCPVPEEAEVALRFVPVSVVEDQRCSDIQATTLPCRTPRFQ